MSSTCDVMLFGLLVAAYAVICHLTKLLQCEEIEDGVNQVS